MSARVVETMPEQEYHAHPALSSSGARKLLPPSCPAIFRHEQIHGQPDRDVFDFGRAAHSLVLGAGADIAALPFDDWRKKAAKEAADEARANGQTPLLEKDAATVTAMADALRSHKIANALLDPSKGKPEQSIFWHDEQHDIDRRARLDWLPNPSSSRLIVTDYKTTPSASPAAIGKHVANYGYHAQAAWYLDAVRAAGLSDDAAFLFVFQEKQAPYLVTVVELDAEALAVGALINDTAMSVFAECTATGVWPGYTDDIELVSLPAWATRTAWETR